MSDGRVRLLDAEVPLAGGSSLSLGSLPTENIH